MTPETKEFLQNFESFETELKQKYEYLLAKQYAAAALGLPRAVSGIEREIRKTEQELILSAAV